MYYHIGGIRLYVLCCDVVSYVIADSLIRKIELGERITVFGIPFLCTDQNVIVIEVCDEIFIRLCNVHLNLASPVCIYNYANIMEYLSQLLVVQACGLLQESDSLPSLVFLILKTYYL